MQSQIIVHNLGYPKIGPKREFKKAIESYWQGELDARDLHAVRRQLRHNHWQEQHKGGIELVPIGDDPLYDSVLCTMLILGILPQRFESYRPYLHTERHADLEFLLARGHSSLGQAQALEMTKWFDTNYHYIVPEWSTPLPIQPNARELIEKWDECQHLGLEGKVCLVGPLTLMRLGKWIQDPDDAALATQIGQAYGQILGELQKAGISWVQFDEHSLTLETDRAYWDLTHKIYAHIRQLAPQIGIILITAFAPIQSPEQILQLPIQVLHVDLIRGSSALHAILEQIPSELCLSLGLIQGRNLWQSNINQACTWIKTCKNAIPHRPIWIAPSCSLAHVPHTLEGECLPPSLQNKLSFAREKLQELQIVQEHYLQQKWILLPDSPSLLPTSKVDWEYPGPRTTNFGRPLPLFPTTSIGSFPQTAAIRQWRQDFKRNLISSEEYENALESEMKAWLDFQCEIGMDLLVHGEFERNDMVEFFGEKLQGFAFSRNGWVLSYGSRCVKPPIIHSQVIRNQPLTINWFRRAQAHSPKPVKGMLTGPITILQWSFVREDQERWKTALEIAQAIDQEVAELQENGARFIQIDEPGLREALPLLAQDQAFYLQWATAAFRHSFAHAWPEVQIHTHMCYANFGEIMDAVKQMNADVISLECARNPQELGRTLKSQAYPRHIGPGCYDIHSPNIPEVSQMITHIKKFCQVFPLDQLWINPDCGLKTRSVKQAKDSLRNMCQAAQELRQSIL